jgi:hypothetical protein
MKTSWANSRDIALRRRGAQAGSQMLGVLTAGALLLAPVAARAACSSPAGVPGQIVYNTDYHVPQYCNGTEWIAFGVVNASGGGAGCSGPAGAEGEIIYNSDYDVVQWCDGVDWRAASGAIASAGNGYFVLTSGNWDGDLVAAAQVIDAGITDGMDAANLLCLTDLTDNDWMGKANAQSRGLLDAAHVKGFFCSNLAPSPRCNNAQARTTYQFAVSGAPADGGATFTSHALYAYAPNDEASWAGATYFNGTHTYWTGRLVGGLNTMWSISDHTDDCNSWTSGTSPSTGRTGTSNATQNSRFSNASPLCDGTYRLVCFVHPE